MLSPPASDVCTGRGFEHVPIFQQIEPFVVQMELEIPQRIDAARTREQKILLPREKLLASDESESMILFGTATQFCYISHFPKVLIFVNVLF